MSDLAQTLEAKADQAAASRQFAEAARSLEQAVKAAPNRAELWSKLSAMRRASGDAEGALVAIERALALSPLDFTFLLARAMLVEKVDPGASGEAYCEAIEQLPSHENVPPAMLGPIAHARAKCQGHRDRIRADLTPLIPLEASPTERGRIARFIGNVSRQSKPFAQEPTHFHYPCQAAKEFHDVSDFAGLDHLSSLTRVIAAEFENLLKAEGGEMVPYVQYPERIPLRQWEALNQNRDWSAFHLIQNGKRIDANARHCPRTIEAVAQFDQPQVTGASPNLMFSLLAPKTRIPPHTGVANTRLVAHLPLIVPPGCGFRCGGTTVEWLVGQPIVFDDTIEHEAWNDSEQLRVVMIFDLWVPQLSAAERQAIAQIIPRSGHRGEGI